MSVWMWIVGFAAVAQAAPLDTAQARDAHPFSETWSTPDGDVWVAASADADDVGGTMSAIHTAVTGEVDVRWGGEHPVAVRYDVATSTTAASDGDIFAYVSRPLKRRFARAASRLSAHSEEGTTPLGFALRAARMARSAEPDPLGTPVAAPPDALVHVDRLGGVLGEDAAAQAAAAWVASVWAAEVAAWVANTASPAAFLETTPGVGVDPAWDATGPVPCHEAAEDAACLEIVQRVAPDPRALQPKLQASVAGAMRWVMPDVPVEIVETDVHTEWRLVVEPETWRPWRGQRVDKAAVTTRVGEVTSTHAHVLTVHTTYHWPA